MEHIILTSSSASGLTKRINEKTEEGWETVGSHQVTTIYSQNKFSGTQHMATQHEIEYSQTMVYEEPKYGIPGTTGGHQMRHP